MNKKRSISFLVVILFCLVLIIFGIFKTQPKIKLIDIKGSKKHIGNLLFISQKSNSIYSNIQSITSKDGFKFKNRVNLSIKKLDLKNDEIFKDSYDENLRYYGKNNIGYIEEEGFYDGVLKVSVINKNLESRKFENYTLDIKQKYDSEGIISYGVDIDGDDLYVLCSQNKGENINYKTGQTLSIDDIVTNVYKLNLKTGETKNIGELVQNKKVKDLEKYCFNYDGKLYSFIKTYPIKKEDNIELFLTYYDIKNNKLENVKINNNNSDFINLNKHEDSKFTIEGNKLYLLDVINNDEKYIKLRKTTLNLKYNKLEDINTYDVEKLENISDVQSFRVIDKKLYLCIQGYDVENPTDYKPRVYKNSIVVVDEKSKETLYMGEYIEDLPELTDQFILKTDEI